MTGNKLTINSTFSKKIFDDKTKVESQGRLSEEVAVMYLSADRIGVRDTYETNSDNPDKIGVRCEYAYQYLAKHASDDWKENILVYDPDDKLTFGGQVDYWLKRILGYTVRAEEIERTDLIRVSFTNNWLRDNIRPKNVGTGVSYIAEVIIAALSCKPGDVLIIENPEIHLHPSGQSELLLFLAFLAENGIQIIMDRNFGNIIFMILPYQCKAFGIRR